MPRVRSHDPILADYRRALETAIAEGDAPVHEAHGRAHTAKHTIPHVKRDAMNIKGTAASRVAALQAEANKADPKDAKIVAKAMKQASDAIAIEVAEHERKVVEAEARAEQFTAEAARIEQTAHLDAFNKCKADWADTKWSVWFKTCEENIAGSTEGLQAKIEAIHAEYEAAATIKAAATAAQIKREHAEQAARQEATGAP